MNCVARVFCLRVSPNYVYSEVLARQLAFCEVFRVVGFVSPLKIAGAT